MKTFFIAVICTIVCTATFAQKFDKTRLDTYFNTLEKNNKFMGSVAVFQNGQIIYTRSAGFSDYENHIKATENSKYRIGSISKTITATLILKAVEEGKITLDKKLADFYPSIKNADMITVEQLLRHRSGIHSFTDDEDYETWNTQPKSEEELLDIISKGNSEFKPDSTFKYSNPNYILLSFILQKIYNKTYAEIVREKIVLPLGLNHTYFGSAINAQNNECYSYSFSGKWEKETETDMSIPMGAGGIVSSPTDMVKFGNALFSGKIISKKSYTQMTNIKDGYGMGLFKLPFYEKEGFGHTGAIDGFSSMLSFYPESGVTFALLSNGNNYSNNQIAITVLSEVFHKPYNIPEFKSFAVTTEDLDKYLGTYITDALPLKLTITKKGATLIAQATGQQQLLLEATDKDVFSFDKAGIVLKFNTEKKTVILEQGGGEYLFTKE
ncbi:MAG TPA: serine hydrolase domain-containing protein [Ferruginibacter sp.]|nr:beta-lactamase family protein [Bacteroidota bacterium]HMT96751.1 serine hydrolase domain-containing protein [Ferruginibacter sp.]